MTSEPTHETVESSPLKGARKLTRQGFSPPAPGAGPVRRLARRFVLRFLKPYSEHQRMVDNRLLDALEQLERRVRTYEALQLDVLTEDLIESLDALRSRVTAGEEVIAGSNAIPYMADGTLERFHDQFAGTVLGYRNRGSPEEAGYVGFEAVFRGPEARVAERQRVYLQLLDRRAPVLDAGCGRGEFLDLLREQDITAQGVDIDAAMVEHCRAKGHEAVAHGTVNEYLEQLPDDSLGTVFSAQLVEHIPYRELARFLELSAAKLRPDGLFVAETVNPHAAHALKTFWVDPTHQHPLFPEVMLVLCRLAGFASAYVFHPLGTGDVERDRSRESEYAVVAKKA
jgi:2-polyprenyl-3-methyl-5-hydroxy-6-metoxy-1,4-benzoquinol methylase